MDLWREIVGNRPQRSSNQQEGLEMNSRHRTKTELRAELQRMRVTLSRKNNKIEAMRTLMANRDKADASIRTCIAQITDARSLAEAKEGAKDVMWKIDDIGDLQETDSSE